MTPTLLKQIPEKLKQYNQFIMWKYEPKEGSNELTKVPYSPVTGNKASSTESSDYAPWVSFEYAVAVLEEHPEWYAGIGFVLSRYDPFLFIDLDNCFKDPSTPELNQQLYGRHIRMYEALGTYAEISPSGLGAHLILEGSVPSGRNCRKKHIEIYSDSRFMTLTGNLVNGIYLDIRTDHQPLINSIYKELGEGRDNPEFVSNFDNGKETYTDDQVIEFCSSNPKFVALFQGQWQDRFKSQSEADLSLCSQAAIYTESKQQLERIFLRSVLARTINRKPDPHAYLHDKDWGILNKAFNKKLPTPDFSGLQNLVYSNISAPVVHDFKIQVGAPEPELIHNCFNDNAVAPDERPTMPPGYMGEIVQYIYDQMPRQVAEYALTAGLALMAGILGRYLNVQKIGLNQYFVQVGKTGTGKEGSIIGMQTLMNYITPHLSAGYNFIGASSYTSYEALSKSLPATPSVVAQFGEISKLLKRILAPNARPSDVAMEDFYLNLYTKSGCTNAFNGAVYASKEKSVPRVQGPAFSFIGDTVPDSFYKLIQQEHVTSGLFPRFSIVEYHGGQPYLNDNHSLVVPPIKLINHIGGMCEHSLKRNQANAFTQITMDEEATILFKDFAHECTAIVNDETTDLFRQLWNRAHIKALKTAGIIAGTQEYITPIITGEIAKWSIKFSKDCVFNLMRRASNNTLGFAYKDNNAQYDDLLTVIGYWANNSWSSLAHYKIGREDLHSKKILPHSFISKMLSRRASYNEDRFGSYSTIKKMVGHAFEMGDLRKLTFVEIHELRVVGDAYMITAPSIVG